MRRYISYFKNTSLANWKAAYDKSLKRFHLCELPVHAFHDENQPHPSHRSNSIVDGLAAILFIVSFAVFICCFGI